MNCDNCGYELYLHDTPTTDILRMILNRYDAPVCKQCGESYHYPINDLIDELAKRIEK